MTCWRSLILPTTKSCCGSSRIALERSAADHVQGKLDLEIAKLAVREFEEGTVRETIEDFEGKIFLARSDLERAKDRVAWAHRMKDKGYIAAAVASAEEFKQNQLMVSLAQQESAFELFKKYTAPKTSKVLRGAVTAAETTLSYQTLRLARHRQRYNVLEKQVEHCTSARRMTASSSTPTTPIARFTSSPAWRCTSGSSFSSCRTSRRWKSWRSIHESIVEHVSSVDAGPRAG